MCELAISLLLLASGVEPNPGPVSIMLNTRSKNSNQYFSCENNIEVDEFVICSRCKNNFHVSCIVKSFKLKYGIPLRNSVNWLHQFLLFGHFMHVCDSCTGDSPAYSEVATSPIHCVSNSAASGAVITDSTNVVIDINKNSSTGMISLTNDPNDSAINA